MQGVCGAAGYLDSSQMQQVCYAMFPYGAFHILESRDVTLDELNYGELLGCQECG